MPTIENNRYGRNWAYWMRGLSNVQKQVLRTHLKELGLYNDPIAHRGAPVNTGSQWWLRRSPSTNVNGPPTMLTLVHRSYGHVDCEIPITVRGETYAPVRLQR